MVEEAVQKWEGYLNFQDTFVWRNLHSYGGLVKSGGLQPPSPPIPPPMCQTLVETCNIAYIWLRHLSDQTNGWQQGYIIKIFLCALAVESGNITIFSYIVILKCRDNRYWREMFSIVISAAQYYHQYRNHRKVYCFKTCKFYVTTKTFQPMFTILVFIILL